MKTVSEIMEEPFEESWKRTCSATETFSSFTPQDELRRTASRRPRVSALL
jgi:hypothetical protein